MKKIFLKNQLLPADKRSLLLILLVLTFSATSYGQSMSLSLSVTNNAPNNCNARTISVSVSGGSGNYSYSWASEPPSSINLGNGPSITVSPAVATTYTAVVLDNVAQQYAQKSVIVSPLLSGSLNVFIPTAFFEGNLWRVLDENQGTGPINAYQYELTIINDWGNLIYAASGTVSSGTTGLVGGQITWNGRLNGTGSYVAAGNYYCDLRLINCSTNQLFRKTITFFRPLNLSVEMYPNPAHDYVELAYSPGSAEQMSAEEEEFLKPEEVQLISSNGELLVSHTTVHLPVRLDVSSLPEDTYSLNLHYGNQVLKKRLVIRR